ncbi:MAG: heavy metal transport/detoxification protein [Comamonadaceae bacterium PBBC1]|nr:MAG: heavy metal transport/detoxification protein [Comamonadaceae bacterium PBBC1]
MKHIFNVEGMTCAHCEKAVSKALLAIDAHAKIVIDRTVDFVEVLSDLPAEKFIQAIEDEGCRVVH